MALTPHEMEQLSLEELRARIAENEAKIADLNRTAAQTRHDMADYYQGVADDPEHADHKDIFDEFKKHYGGDEKVARKQLTSWARTNAKSQRELAKEPLSVQVALSKGANPPPGYAKAPPAPAKEDDPWMRKLLGQG